MPDNDAINRIRAALSEELGIPDREAWAEAKHMEVAIAAFFKMPRTGRFKRTAEATGYTEIEPGEVEFGKRSAER